MLNHVDKLGTSEDNQQGSFMEVGSIGLLLSSSGSLMELHDLIKRSLARNLGAICKAGAP